MSRLPPGQQLVAAGKWPVVGERAPLPPPETWTLDISGLVEQPRSFSLGELQSFRAGQYKCDIHCVTRWSKLDVVWTGVELRTLLDACRPQPAAKFVSFMAHSPRAHSTSLPLDDALQLGVIVVWAADGVPLALEHGGPLRIVTPQRYFYKSVKWVSRVELLENDRLGYWEANAGYHNHADPWQEQRYLAARVTKQEAARLIASRDFRDRDLLGIVAAGRELAGLRAERALLRNADFRDAQLQGADFTSANLSNAHFERASLQAASLRDADLEGANFEGADLRGACLVGASIFGATFVPPGTPLAEQARRGARVDRHTQFNPVAFEQLTPEQADYLRRTWPQHGG